VWYQRANTPIPDSVYFIGPNNTHGRRTCYCIGTTPQYQYTVLECKNNTIHANTNSCILLVAALFPDATNTPADDKLTAYLGGKHKILLANADQCLKWWKVSYLELYFQSFYKSKRLITSSPNNIQEHHQDFPILSLMDRDYLALLATSASFERCFSAAADICAEDCRSLALRTNERCVNSHQWLQKGYQAKGNFKTEQDIITQGMEELKLNNRRPKVCNTERTSMRLARQ
jgi:hypothetical protein